MATPEQQDSGLVQRGLLLLGGMTALVVVVFLIALRRPDEPARAEARPLPPLPMVAPAAGYPGTLGLPAVVSLGQALPSAPGWEIRYNAALALARRGSPKTPWPLIREMLDEDRQLRNFRVTLKNGQDIPKEEDARRTVENALVAVAQWHKKQPPGQAESIPADLQLVYHQIDHLAQSGSTPLRVQADRVRQGLRQ